MNPSFENLVARSLPPDDGLRFVLHNEVHARPAVRIRLPALVFYVAVINAGVTRAQEFEHLKCLPGQEQLSTEDLSSNFLRLQFDGCSLNWERHSEFTRYAWVQPLPIELGANPPEDESLQPLAVARGWLSRVPGQTFCAIELAMLHGDVADANGTLERARQWFADGEILASLVGSKAHSMVVTDFQVRNTGFERMLVISAPETSESRAGRIFQRLINLETYRLMALRGLPTAKALQPELAAVEEKLATITLDMEKSTSSDQAMLDTLVGLAARVEKAIAQHQFRFSATRAYQDLVAQRISELRERPIEGTQTLCEFMQRRFFPAMATVASTEQRLGSLSERVSRASALLRTRVDIATEGQNQQLLEKLTRGQELQLRLQTTVEGLSIAAISYYVISLLLYGAKALKSVGVPINPEMATGAMIPLVLWAVWRTTRRIHAKLHNTTH